MATAEAVRLVQREHHLATDQTGIAERFSGNNGLERVPDRLLAKMDFARAGVPLLVGALATVPCEVEEIVERHSQSVVIGRVRYPAGRAARLRLSAYWHGEYVAIDRDDGFRSTSGSQLSLPGLRR